MAVDRAEVTDASLTVFLSYSRRDVAVADALVSSLEARNIKVLIDRRDLPYGEAWQTELADFIAASDTVIWLVSPYSVASKWCNWELDEVQKQHKRLVPVRVGDVAPEELPRQLGQIHILPVEGVFDLSNHLDVLVTTLETDRGWLKEHTRLLDRAQQWIAKDKSDGLLLRGRALKDAEQWQALQPQKAPSPSPEILDLIVQSEAGATRRQRTLIGSLVAGLIVAIGLAGFAFWQSTIADEQRMIADQQKDLAEAESKRVVRATTLSGWRAFEEPKEACKAMREYTGEEGLRALYCHVRDIVSYGQIEEMAGIPVFLKGPHEEGKLRVREHSFGHYNPAFIDWVQKELLPAPDDSVYLAATKPIYNQYIRRMARAYHRAFVGWSWNHHHFARERAYLLEMISGERPWSYMGARFQAWDVQSIFGVDIEAEDLNDHHFATALRFWQRRSIDGTADQMFDVLEQAMSIYDADWLTQAPPPPDMRPYLVPVGGEIAQPLDPSKPFLPEPTGGEFFLNDVVVIE